MVSDILILLLVTLKKWELNRLNGVKDVTIDVVCSVFVDRITYKVEMLILNWISQVYRGFGDGSTGLPILLGISTWDWILIQ